MALPLKVFLSLSSSSSKRLPLCRKFVTKNYNRQPGRRKMKLKRRLEQESAKNVSRRPSIAKNEQVKSARTDAPSSIQNKSFMETFSTWMYSIRSKAANHSKNPRDWILPQILRYRFPEPQPFRPEHRVALAQRLPFFILLAMLMTHDETCPIKLIRIKGPSMLPTMAADGSEVWVSLRLWCYFPFNSLKNGDIVGFSHPDNPRRVSCKRIIGMPRDPVHRYGQYVQLFTKQDPIYWGVTPIPKESAEAYHWVSDDWDSGLTRDPKQTMLVPEGHVWLEADCPGFGIDSRHFGPIPIEWIRGRVVARLWPLWPLRRDVRPHPIPLDAETLMEYNVYRI